MEDYEHEPGPRALVALTLAAAVLRLSGLSAELSVDEAFRVLWVMQAGEPFVSQGAVRCSGALLSAAWIKLAWSLWQSPVLLRLPFALAGVLSVPLLACAAARIARSEKTGLIAGWMLALSPFHLIYSHQAEEYVFAALFALLSFELVRALCQTPERAAALAPRIAGIELLGLLLGGYWVLPFFLAAALPLGWQLRGRLSAGGWAALVAAQIPLLGALALVLPPLLDPAARAMHGVLSADLVIQRPGAALLGVFFAADAFLRSPAIPPWAVALESGAAFLLLGALIHGARLLWQRESARTLALATLFGPLLMAAALTLAARPGVFYARGYAAFAPALVLLAASAFAGLPRRAAVALGAAGVIVVGAMIAAGSSSELRDAMSVRALLGRVSARLAPEAVVRIHPQEFAPVVAFYAMAPATRWRGIDSEPPATAAAWAALAEGAGDALLDGWAGRISAAGDCALFYEPALHQRDPLRGLDARLRAAGYAEAFFENGTRVLCPQP